MNSKCKETKRLKYGASSSKKICFCTIASNNYIANAITSIQSLGKHHPEADLFVLISDTVDLNKQNDFFKNINFIDISGIECLAVQRYRKDSLRWSLKPYLISHLLNQYEKVIYTDNDVYCTDTLNYILNLLDTKGIAITPHWRSHDPNQPVDGLNMIMVDGYFNAGVMGASRKGSKILRWWKKACAWKCPQNRQYGLYSDQRYLDLMPILFPDETISVDHRGYNVATWNLQENKRSIKDNKIYINDTWPLVLTHLCKSRLNEDPIMVQVHEEYDSNIKMIKKILHENNLSVPTATKTWGIYLDEVGPLEGKLWTLSESEKMLELFKKGLVQGHKKDNSYEIKSIEETLFLDHS